MKLDELRAVIQECCNDVVFIYNGLDSGVTSEVRDSIPIYQSWHGSRTKEYVRLDDLMLDKFFSGKSIIDLITKVDFNFA